MTFLVLAMNAEALISQKSDLEYQELVYNNEYTSLTEEETSYLAEKNQSSNGANGTNGANGANNNSSADLANDQELQYIKAQESFYMNKKTAIETQLKAITESINGYKEAAKENIKSECKLSISV